MLNIIQNIFRIEELRQRIFFTLAMLFIFRLGAHIPTPGIDGSALSAFFEAQQGSILRFFDMFTGGALARLTVFALGVMPYISASIIIQLLTAVFPYLERLSKEGDAGRKKITGYTRYGTIVLSVVQGFAIAVGLESMAAPNGQPNSQFRKLTFFVQFPVYYETFIFQNLYYVKFHLGGQHFQTFFFPHVCIADAS